jgi:hypothetical protein
MQHQPSSATTSRNKKQILEPTCLSMANRPRLNLRGSHSSSTHRNRAATTMSLQSCGTLIDHQLPHTSISITSSQSLERICTLRAPSLTPKSKRSCFSARGRPNCRSRSDRETNSVSKKLLDSGESCLPSPTTQMNPSPMSRKADTPPRSRSPCSSNNRMAQHHTNPRTRPQTSSSSRRRIRRLRIRSPSK